MALCRRKQERIHQTNKYQGILFVCPKRANRNATEVHNDILAFLIPWTDVDGRDGRGRTWTDVDGRDGQDVDGPDGRDRTWTDGTGRGRTGTDGTWTDGTQCHIVISTSNIKHWDQNSFAAVKRP